MLDIGWYEIFVIAVITVIIVGPKELPRVLRAVTKITRKIREMASEFQSGIDDIAREAELDDLKKSIEEAASTDIAGELENTIDPTGELTESVRELGDSIKEDPVDTGDVSGDQVPEQLAVTTASRDTGDTDAKPAKSSPAKRKSSKKKPRPGTGKRKADGDK
jgi:sec-independent protein translocase protein TatB